MSSMLHRKGRRRRDRSRPSDSLLPRSEGLDHAEGAFRDFMVASGGVLSEGYGHSGPGVYLGDGQTENEGVTSKGGRGDAHMPPYLTFLNGKG